MRPLIFATTAAALALSGVFAVPAQAATATYGWAWSDGQGHLRIVPKSATRVRVRGNVLHRLKDVSGAKELRLDYTRTAYSRVTLACDLKETEGRVALDSRGLGRTRCSSRDLATELGRGALPVRVEHQ